jgi:hypothetical protein
MFVSVQAPQAAAKSAAAHRAIFRLNYHLDSSSDVANPGLHDDFLSLFQHDRDGTLLSRIESRHQFLEQTWQDVLDAVRDSLSICAT